MAQAVHLELMSVLSELAIFLLIYSQVEYTISISTVMDGVQHVWLSMANIWTIKTSWDIDVSCTDRMCLCLILQYHLGDNWLLDRFITRSSCQKYWRTCVKKIASVFFLKNMQEDAKADSPTCESGLNEGKGWCTIQSSLWDNGFENYWKRIKANISCLQLASIHFIAVSVYIIVSLIIVKSLATCYKKVIRVL